MKQYKIVKHHISPEDCIFRIFERKLFFFWEWVISFDNIQRCEEQINWLKASAIEKKAKVENTPKPETIAYL